MLIQNNFITYRISVCAPGHTCDRYFDNSGVRTSFHTPWLIIDDQSLCPLAKIPIKIEAKPRMNRPQRSTLIITCTYEISNMRLILGGSKPLSFKSWPAYQSLGFHMYDFLLSHVKSFPSVFVMDFGASSKWREWINYTTR